MKNHDGPRWLLLIHQIPPAPGYLRVKVWRRLQKLGAVAIKNSVYALPLNVQSREDLEWVVREIVEGGGEAFICEANFVEGMDDHQIEALFHAARDVDYARITEECRAIVETGGGTESGGVEFSEAVVARLRRRFEDILTIDFFASRGRLEAMGAIAEIEELLRKSDPSLLPGEGHVELDRSEYRDRTWVTREGIYVDRMASAWLIRRFIDTEATFKFVPATGYREAPGELGFDMFDAAFSHIGDRCTFEVLLKRFSIDDPALADIGEIVHDIDLKDAKFSRKESVGIAAQLTGMALRNSDDEVRLARGAEVFDDLYVFFTDQPDRSNRPQGRR